MKRYIVAFGLVSCFLGPAATQEFGPQHAKLTVANGVKCAAFYGTGNLSTVYVQMAQTDECNHPWQFSINWYGNSPPNVVTYRTNNGKSGFVRDVSRRDINGELISDGPATMGLGPSTKNFSMQEIPGPQGYKRLEIVDGEQQPIFTGGYISIRQGGNEVGRTGGSILIEPIRRWPVWNLSPSQTYVSVLTAEKDPN